MGLYCGVWLWSIVEHGAVELVGIVVEVETGYMELEAFVLSTWGGFGSNGGDVLPLLGFIKYLGYAGQTSSC